jgi:hypothetical protein
MQIQNLINWSIHTSIFHINDNEYNYCLTGYILISYLLPHHRL